LRTEPSVCTSVHPRASGEHDQVADLLTPEHGSSPRERGTPLPCWMQLPCERFIPARAGNTAFQERCRHLSAVHPRASGEHLNPSAMRWIANGSSPRERGTPHMVKRGGVGDRFIPARAGNTPSSQSLSPPWSVHPRASGEHSSPAWPPPFWTGSSPRERGTHNSRCGPVPHNRFIPARAGNTVRARIDIADGPVHPRASGEHRCRVERGDAWRGSSPRERGTHRGARQPVGANRFIPARAGNTSRSTTKAARLPVHPRASGEHLQDMAISIGEAGSSPRERGTHRRPGRRHLRHRFIPARAGNTQARAGLALRCAVHPRASGEHHHERLFSGHGYGSSPRERGTPP